MNSRRFLRGAGGALLVMTIGGCRGAAPAPRPAPAPAPRSHARTVIVLGFDGFARRYLDADSAPALHALARTGVSSRGMIPSFPTITFPNFYALATGLYPDHSGIVSNRFFDPAHDGAFEYKKPIAHEGYWWGGEPIWVTATRQGAPAATMFWVGSDAPVDHVRPAHWHSYDHGIPFSARVDTMLAWLDLSGAERPRLVMGYFEEPDTQGHRHGPDAPQTAEAVLRVDSALAQLVRGLEARKMYDSVDVVIVADHGMARISTQNVVYLDDVVDSASVNVVTLSPNLSISARDGDDVALVRKLEKLPHVSAWKKGDVPARLHYGTSARITAVIAVADPGWMIAWRHGRPLDMLGEHGYDNANLDMRALFLAHGPDFRAGTTIGEFPNVDVYSLLARLLGVKPAKNDGTIEPFESVLK